jgi:DNA-binding transcriptional regulator YiaG
MSDICCIKGCEKEVLAMGLCVNHWRMNKKHGSPVAVRQLAHANRGLSAEDRFWKSVTKTDGCWLWNAGCDRDGYGVFDAFIHGIKTKKAHRFSHMLSTGEVLDRNVFVMHSCDNPQCVNPSHLSSGSAAENTADMIRKGRHVNGRKSQLLKVQKVSDAQVVEILKDPRSYDDIAASYGIHRQSIVAIKGRTTRQGVQVDESQIVRRKRGAAGEARSKTLTEADIRFIRDTDMRNTDIAAKYGVSQQTICDIRKRRSWKDVH